MEEESCIGGINDCNVHSNDLCDNNLSANPASDILHEIYGIFRKYESKEDILEAIIIKLKSSSRELLSTTRNIWFKKHEKVQQEKSVLERKLERSFEMIFILLCRIMGLSNDQLDSCSINEVKGVDLNNIEQIDENTIKLTFDQPWKSKLLKESHSNLNQLYSDRKCPLCKNNLHHVFDDIDEKDATIVNLRKDISDMTNKGMILISQNQMGMAENERLKNRNKKLQESHDFIESKLKALLLGETELKKRYSFILENSRKELEEALSKISSLESKLAFSDQNFLKLSWRESLEPIIKKDVSVSCTPEELKTSIQELDDSKKIKSSNSLFNTTDKNKQETITPIKVKSSDSILTLKIDASGDASTNNHHLSSRSDKLTVNIGSGILQSPLRINPKDENNRFSMKFGAKEEDALPRRRTAAFNTHRSRGSLPQQNEILETNNNRISTKNPRNCKVKEDISYKCTLI